MTENDINLKLCECGHCNELISVYDNQKRFRRYKRGHNTKKNSSMLGQIGKLSPSYKNGFRKNGDYIEILKHDHPNVSKSGYIMSHRLIYENYLSILFDEDVFIPKKWDVHHINSNGLDNSLINLELLSHKEHKLLHWKKDHSKTLCLLCNQKTCKSPKTGHEYWYRYLHGYVCRKCYWRINKR